MESTNLCLYQNGSDVVRNPSCSVSRGSVRKWASESHFATFYILTNTYLQLGLRLTIMLSDDLR